MVSAALTAVGLPQIFSYPPLTWKHNLIIVAFLWSLMNERSSGGSVPLVGLAAAVPPLSADSTGINVPVSSSRLTSAVGADTWDDTLPLLPDER